MKLHTTIGYENAKAAHAAAYATYDGLAEAGRDTGPDAEAAQRAEGETLAAYLLHPCSTPKEVAEKLAMVDKRDIAVGWDIYPSVASRLQADLLNMVRPNASPTIAEGFDAFARAHRAHCFQTNADDAHDNDLCHAVGRAVRGLLDLPCTTAGDFIVKAYVNLLTSTGPVASEDGKTLAAFEIDAAALEDAGTLDGAYEVSVLRDIRASDLGCCLLSLGRTDFDAGAWIAAAEFAGHDFSVTVDESGKRSFCQGMFNSVEDRARDDRSSRLMRLLAFDHARVVAVIAAVVANHPQRVINFMRQAVEA